MPSAPAIAARTLFLALLAGLLLPGCTSLRREPIETSIPPPGGMLRIVGYTSPDGVFHDFRGTLSAAGPDSLRLRTADGIAERVVARDQVQSVLFRKGDPARTGMVALGVGTLLMASFVGLVIVLFNHWD